MNKKLLDLFAEEIKNEVPYLDNKQMVAAAVINVAKKTMRWDEKKGTEFLKKCGLRS